MYKYQTVMQLVSKRSITLLSKFELMLAFNFLNHLRK